MINDAFAGSVTKGGSLRVIVYQINDGRSERPDIIRRDYAARIATPEFCHVGVDLSQSSDDYGTGSLGCVNWSEPDEMQNVLTDRQQRSYGRLSSRLRTLEAEAIHILRETEAEFRRPVMLYSIGKDSCVLLHLARKAFHPQSVPLPVVHVDTTWKFREMIAFRDAQAQALGLDLVVHTNQDGVAQGIDPIAHGAAAYTHVMKTEALRQVLDRLGADAAIGGARRDEEKSRAKERIFSVRARGHRWNPKSQRPEPWGLANTRLSEGETMRVFPLSNWTELDVWTYIRDEGIPVVPLYFAKPRPVVRRGASWLMVDDDRLLLGEGEEPELRSVRFRTLGCYPLTGAIESEAATLEDIIDELGATRHSERAGRLIDGENADSIEAKKEEGYF